MFWLAQPQSAVQRHLLPSKLQAGYPMAFLHSHPLRSGTMEERLELWLRWDWAQILIVGRAEGTDALSWNLMRLKGAKPTVVRVKGGVAVRGQRKGPSRLWQGETRNWGRGAWS